MADTRERQHGFTGSYRESGTFNNSQTNARGISSIERVTSERHGDHKNPNGFYHSKGTSRAKVQNGQQIFGDPYGAHVKVKFESWPSQYLQSAGQRVGTYPSVNLVTVATKALGNSNPSRPVADLGVAFGEIRDIPKLLKFAGDTLLRKGSNAYLAYQFGWKPLISDIRDVLDFQKQVGMRTDELKRMHAQGGIKRRTARKNDRTFSNTIDLGTVNLDSISGSLIQGRASGSDMQKVWCTTSWFVENTNSMPPSDRKLHMQAMRAVYGLTVDASTAWNLLPWSWLIDWFGSAGDYFAATRNIVGAYSGPSCVMVNEKSQTVISRLPPSASNAWISGGGGDTQFETKTRFVVGTPSPFTATFPHISGKQASILGALAIQRVPRNLLR